jgi:O-antigen/teichoic acid export membrane protein
MSAGPSASGPRHFRLHVLHNAISNYLGKAVDLTTWLVLTPFILAHLGLTGFGLWTLVSSVVGYTSLLDFGATNAVIKYVAEYRVHRDGARIRPLLATVFLVYVAIGGLVLLLSIVLAPVLAGVLDVPDQERIAVALLTLVMGITAGLAFPCTVPLAALQGLQRYMAMNLLTSVWTLSSAAATVVVLQLGGDVLDMVAVNIPIALMMLVVSVWVLLRKDPQLRPSLSDSRRSLLRPIASYSWSLLVTNVAWRLETKTDEIVIGALIAVSAVTPYSLARRMAEGALILTEQFRRLLLPIASELHAVDDRERLKQLYLVGTRLTLAIYVPLGGTLSILAGPILTVWVGRQFADQGYLVAILTAASLLMTAQKPGISILQGIARHRPLAGMAVLSGLFNLLLSVILAPRFGLAGVAVGTLIPTAAVYLGLISRYTVRTLDIDTRLLLREVVWPVTLPAIPAAAVLLVLRSVLDTPSLLLVLGIAVVGLLTYAAVYLVLGAAEFERSLVRSFAHEALRPVRL